MIAADGTPNVLEFNCRFGDPETQPILMRLQSDLVELCEAALAGTLERIDAALGSARRARRGDGGGRLSRRLPQGRPDQGLDAAARLPGKVFHAGTARRRSADRDRGRTGAVRGRPRRQASAPRSARPTRWCTRFTGIGCSTGATSATGRSRARAKPRGGRPPHSNRSSGGRPALRRACTAASADSRCRVYSRVSKSGAVMRFAASMCLIRARRALSAARPTASAS